MTDKTSPPSKSADQFVVRLPEGMRDRIAQAAKESGRSMNSELVQRIEQSFDTPHIVIREIPTPRLPLPEPVQMRLESAAALNDRSIIDEIAARLAASFDFQKLDLSPMDLMEAMHWLQHKNPHMKYQLLISTRDTEINEGVEDAKKGFVDIEATSDGFPESKRGRIGRHAKTK